MHEALYQTTLDGLRETWPSLRVVSKAESRLSRWIDRCLRLLTGGRQSRYMTEFVTTLGSTIYVPESWPQWPASERYLILRHEAVHVGQFTRYGWPAMVLLYLLLPLPFGLAAGRAWLEWQAYAETLTATWELKGPEAARDPVLREKIVRRFTGPDYAWMWVHGKSVHTWIDRKLTSLSMDPPSSPSLPDL
jgi:hypothetical protein